MIWRNQPLKAAASAGAFSASRVETWRNDSIDLVLISAGLLSVNSALRPSRAALRPSLVEKSATTALISALAFGSAANLVSVAPPAHDSFKSPQSPLGSAAVMAIPAIIGLFRSSVHSSFVKPDLSAIDFLLM